MMLAPREIFSAESHPQNTRVMIAPGRYIQGAGVFDQLGTYLKLVPAKRAAVLLTSGGQSRLGARLKTALSSGEVAAHTILFDGECSHREVEACVAAINEEAGEIDCLVAIGGGKCLDAGKAIAHRLNKPVVICPTIASTDAPTSAVAVMYDDHGVSLGGEFYPHSPAMVVIDSAIVAQAPARYLAAGMADALASVYELRAVLANPNGRSMVGGRPTFTVASMVEACRDILLRDGQAAFEAAQNKQVTPELENVIEANTLTSGIGFESGGLAAVHAVAAGLTVIPKIRQNILHGEQVAIGILTQLALQGDDVEGKLVSTFFQSIGLPTSLGDIGLASSNGDELKQVVKRALEMPIIRNFGIEISAELLLNTLKQLDQKNKS
ncbi:MAG: glycerol dehydrogenase [Chloroflexota bacterium]